MSCLNFELAEIMHLASQAIMSDDQDVKRLALGDIADAIASILPRNPHPMTYCEIAPGVVLKRFRAGDRVQFVGSNRSTVPDENNQHIYRCDIFKVKAMEDPDYVAECYIDGDSVLQLFSTSRSRLEKVALSAFRKYLYTNRNRRDRRRFHRTAEQRGQETAAPVEEPSAGNPVNPVEEPTSEELENA